MSSAAAPRPRSPAVRRVLTRSTALLTLVVVGGAVARIALSAGRTTPRYLPDEYLYPELARAIGGGEGVSILGRPTGFAALLEPVLVAPLWRSDDVAAAIAATQALHSVLMALAAVPVYLLARRVSLGERAALLCAATAAVAPGLFFASLLTADALGYLLALTAAAAAVSALEHATWRNDAAFLLAAALATAARTQYALLVPVYLVAAVAVERGPRAAIRHHPLVVGATATAVVGVGLAGADALGRYSAVTGFGVSTEAARWVGESSFLLVVATGLVLAPGAVSWAGAALVRGSDRARTALAAVSVALIGSLLAATSLLTVETASDRFIERYLIVAAPLVAIGFACWLDEGRPARWVAAGLGIGMIVVAARAPLSGWTAGQGVADSPTLLALSRLEPSLGVGDTSLVAAAIVTLGALVVVALALRTAAAGVAVATAAAALLATSLGSHLGDGATSDRVRSGVFARDPSWIEGSAVDDVLLVQTPGSERIDAELTILMNPSIRRAAPLGREAIESFDGLDSRPLHIDARGVLLHAGRPVGAPVVWAAGGTAVAFQDARSIRRDRRFALVVPRRTVRLSMVGVGLRSDGTLGQAGVVTVYPTGTGRCTRAIVTLSVPRGSPSAQLLVWAPGRLERELTLREGDRTRLMIDSRVNGPASLRFRMLRIGTRAPSPFDSRFARADYRTAAVRCKAQAP